jgi:small subunit ribosomal protein S6e
MNVTISDPKTRKAYSKKVEELPPAWAGQKLGSVVRLDSIGLDGFEGKITGGSDKEGFPMHPTLSGTGRKKIFSYKGTGFRSNQPGERRRKAVRGNTLSRDLAQLNIVVTKNGSKKLEELLGKEPKAVEEKKSAKEEMVEKSLAGVGDESIAEEAKKIKGKTKG